MKLDPYTTDWIQFVNSLEEYEEDDIVKEVLIFLKQIIESPDLDQTLFEIHQKLILESNECKESNRNEELNIKKFRIPQEIYRKELVSLIQKKIYYSKKPLPHLLNALCQEVSFY